MDLVKDCASSTCHKKSVQNGKGFKQCSGCKVVCYCSKICQKEHWRKVHKLHCKNLRPSEDNGESGIVVEKLDVNGFEMNSPFGSSLDFLDHTLKELHLISLAIDQVGLQIVVERNVKKIRSSYWLHVLQFGNSWISISRFLVLEETIRGITYLTVTQQIQNVEDVHFLLKSQLLLVLATYKHASTFADKMFLDLGEEIGQVLGRIYKDFLIFASSCTSSLSSPLSTNVLNRSFASALEHSKIFLFGGNTLEACLVCKTPLAPSFFKWWSAVGSGSPNVDCGSYYQLLGLRGAIACCGKEVCNKEIYDLGGNDLLEISVAMDAISGWKLIVYRCDYCGRRSRVHRCSACKSRWYCGAECQGEDWSLVHKEVCGKLMKGKKQRFNSDERKKAALQGWMCC